MQNPSSILEKDYIDLPHEYWSLLDKFVPPNEVCHYTSRDKALEYIFNNDEILLGNLNETNDPKETKLRIFQYINTPKNKYDVMGNIHTLDILKNIKVFCACSHNNPALEIVNRENNLEDYIYGASRSPMWAHYGDKHKGVCIIFDAKKLHKNICNKIIENGGEPKKDLRCGFVLYDYRESIAPSQGNNDDVYSLMQNYERNFLRKSPDWKLEREFRWIVAADQQAKLLVSVKDAIRAVVVGCDFNDVYLPLLQNKCKELNAELGKISWVIGRPEINFL